MKTISSQRYIDESIVEEKIHNSDFTVYVSPSFEIDGEGYRVVMDGHHSMEAAKATGNKPVFIELDAQDSDKVLMLDRGNVEGFLEQAWMDSDWYDIDTGVDVW